MNRDVKVWDIWGGACSNICNTEKFFKWAERNGYISEAGNPKTSAEVVFQYITGKSALRIAKSRRLSCIAYSAASARQI